MGLTFEDWGACFTQPRFPLATVLQAVHLEFPIHLYMLSSHHLKMANLCGRYGKEHGVDTETEGNGSVNCFHNMFQQG